VRVPTIAVTNNAYRKRATVRTLPFVLLTASVITTLVHAQAGTVPAFAAADAFASPRISALRRAVGEQDPAAIDRFWSDVRASGAPLVEAVPGEAHSSLVTFVYRGTAQTRNVVVVDGVAVAVGGVDPKNSEMTQLAGTDVWYRTYTVRNDARFAYKISENDPLQSGEKYPPVILDNLIEQRRIPATVAVMVGSPAAQRNADLSCTSRFTDFPANEVVPWLRSRYSATADPRLTVVAGSSLGGLASSCAAFQHPDVFGKVLSQSGSYWWTPHANACAEYLTGQFARAPKLPLQFFLEVGEWRSRISETRTGVSAMC
jgi:putative esterase/uncharacterized protein DUF3327